MAYKGLNCGVYTIEHMASGLRYVGSACLILKRWKEHLRQLTENRHHSRFLQRAWNKYGESVFRFSMILYCDKQNLLTYEQALIDFYVPEYNSIRIGKAMGISIHAADAVIGRHAYLWVK